MLEKCKQEASEDMFAQGIVPSVPCQSLCFWVNQMLDLAMLIYVVICRIRKFSVRISSARFLLITGIILKETMANWWGFFSPILQVNLGHCYLYA